MAVVTIKHRRGTAAQWETANPVLAIGEPAYETDTNIEKIGDGTTAYNDLIGKLAPESVVGSWGSLAGRVEDDDGISLDLSTRFGLTADGVAYYDPDGADAADAAVLGLTETGTPALTRVARTPAVTEVAEPIQTGPIQPVAATSTTPGTVKVVGTPTDAVNPVVRVKESSDAAYAAQMARGVAFPPGFSWSMLGSGVQPGLNARGNRLVMPKTGTLVGIAAFIVTAGGNLAVGLYDTGDAAAGSRTRLWDSGSIAAPASGANTWQQICAPGIAVTQGQEIDAFIGSDSTPVFGRFTPAGLAQAGVLQLPSTWALPPGGALPKFHATIPALAALGTWPTTITEANVTSSLNACGLLALVA